MNWMTPVRIAQAFSSKERRAPYVTRARRDLWKVLSGLPFDLDVTAKLDKTLRISLSNRDVALAPSIFENGRFEEGEIRFIQEYLKPGMMAIDIGANIGVHTLIVAQSVGAAGRVHSFEPSAVFERLQRNISLNSFSDRVVLNHCAVGRKSGTMVLMKCKSGFEAYTSANSPCYESASTGETFTSNLITLDEYAAVHDISQIDFLKIDVEGAEQDVVEGAHSLLECGRIRCVLMEVNPICLPRAGSSPNALLNFMRHSECDLHMLGKDGKLLSLDAANLDKTVNVVCFPRS